jgi:NADH-quinone oxidoreductase subunit C
VTEETRNASGASDAGASETPATEPAATPPTAEQHPTIRLLRERLPDAVLEVHDDFGDLTALVAPRHLVAVARLLRTEPSLDYDFLMDIAAVDRLRATPRFEVVYNFYSLSRRERIRIKTRVPESEPVLDTLTPLWKGADWFEREAYDMMGVRFRGHPNLVRILTHPEFIGHPLRKDYDAARRHPLSRSYDLFDAPAETAEEPATTDAEQR